MTAEFTRETSRTFVVAPDFAPIVALCGFGAELKNQFRAETEKGKIVLLLNEKSSPELNTNKIAIADEIFITSPDGEFDEFQAAMMMTARVLGKHIRFLEDK